jgi:hypothetical protein
MARKRLRHGADKNAAGLALAGLILGYAGTVATIFFAALLLPALARAKERARKITCVGHIKQINLAAIIWSQERQLTLPPDFLTMSNELDTPKLLVCPADSGKTAAADWSQFDATRNLSYEFVLPGARLSAEGGERIVFRCPIHENVGLTDGSVQQGKNRGMKAR